MKNENIIVLHARFLFWLFQVHVHGHDRNASICTVVAEQEGTTDALDTWHSGKEVIKAMKKIAQGAAKWSGVKWHPQLSDKTRAVKTHCYWAMLNCQQDPQKIKDALDNIIPHYQGQHNNCSDNSRCKGPHYIPSRNQITDPAAANLLRETIRSLYLYKHPEKYVNCISTHYVESFNNVALIYLDKRIHFQNQMYMLRIGLSILDWNENVDRPTSSIRHYVQPGMHMHRQGKRVLKAKTFLFVDEVWGEFLRLLHAGIAQDVGEDVEHEDVDSDEDDDQNNE